MKLKYNFDKMLAEIYNSSKLNIDEKATALWLSPFEFIKLYNRTL